MRPALRNKLSFGDDFSERKGMINIYACTRCGEYFIYFYKDSGHTPNHVPCVSCGFSCISQFNNTQQPGGVYVWSRPESEELKAIAKSACDVLGDSSRFEEIYSNYCEHYNNGGLFAQITE